MGDSKSGPWTEWSGGRIVAKARAQRESEGSKSNKWQEAAVVSATPTPTPSPIPVPATEATYWKVSNTDDLGWRPKVRNFALFSDAQCKQRIDQAADLICVGAYTGKPCSNAANGKIPPLTAAERSIVNCNADGSGSTCRYSAENVAEEKVSWRPNIHAPKADQAWIGRKFSIPVDVKCAVSTGLGNVYDNGVSGIGFGRTSVGGKHRITLWKSDDGKSWTKVATSDGSNNDDVVVVS